MTTCPPRRIAIQRLTDLVPEAAAQAHERFMLEATLESIRLTQAEYRRISSWRAAQREALLECLDDLLPEWEEAWESTTRGPVRASGALRAAAVIVDLLELNPHRIRDLGLFDRTLDAMDALARIDEELSRCEERFDALLAVAARRRARLEVQRHVAEPEPAVVPMQPAQPTRAFVPTRPAPLEVPDPLPMLADAHPTPGPRRLDDRGFASDVSLAWELRWPEVEQLADSAVSGWERLVHAHTRLVTLSEQLTGARCAASEGADAVAEALTELEKRARQAGKREWFEGVKSDRLAETIRRLSEGEVPPRLAGIVGRLFERVRFWLADLDEAQQLSGLHEDATRRFEHADRRFRLRSQALHAAVRRRLPLRRAA